MCVFFQSLPLFRFAVHCSDRQFFQTCKSLERTSGGKNAARQQQYGRNHQSLDGSLLFFFSLFCQVFFIKVYTIYQSSIQRMLSFTSNEHIQVSIFWLFSSTFKKSISISSFDQFVSLFKHHHFPAFQSASAAHQHWQWIKDIHHNIVFSFIVIVVIFYLLAADSFGIAERISRKTGITREGRSCCHSGMKR